MTYTACVVIITSKNVFHIKIMICNLKREKCVWYIKRIVKIVEQETSASTAAVTETSPQTVASTAPVTVSSESTLGNILPD